MGHQTILSNFVNGIYCKQQLLDRDPVSFYNMVTLQDEPLELETNSIVALIGLRHQWPMLEYQYRFEPGISEALFTIMCRELTRFVSLTVMAYVMAERPELLTFLPALPNGLMPTRGLFPSAQSQLNLADTIWQDVTTELKVVHACRGLVRSGYHLE